jgi:hypothetical protein
MSSRRCQCPVVQLFVLGVVAGSSAAPYKRENIENRYVNECFWLLVVDFVGGFIEKISRRF